MPVDLDKAVVLDGSIHLVSYDKRTRAKVYPSRPPRKHNSPIVWRGEHKSAYVLGESVVQAPEDRTAYTLHYEPAYKGEIDIQLHLATDYDISTEEVKEAALGTSLAAMAFINLKLGDLLTPVAPIQVREIVGSQLVASSSFTVLAWNRSSLDTQTLEATTKQYARIFRSTGVSESQKAKLRVALGLYAAHFSERAATSRFLTLVMALEALATSAPRPKLALTLIDRWKQQVDEIKSKLQPGSDDFTSLEALQREILFRREDSIRSQIRRLVFDVLSAQGNTDAPELSRRAVKVYDKRSTLVHGGLLAVHELHIAERDAKEILERVLKAECQIT